MFASGFPNLEEMFPWYYVHVYVCLYMYIYVCVCVFNECFDY